MLTQQEIENVLFHSAEIFQSLVDQKEWIKAKICYQNTLLVAAVVKLDPEKMDKLFGSRQVDPPMIGAFSEEMVLKVLERCFSIEKKSEETEAELRRIRQNQKSGKQVMEESKRQFWQNQNTGSQRIEDLRKEWQ